MEIVGRTTRRVYLGIVHRNIALLATLCLLPLTFCRSSPPHSIAATELTIISLPAPAPHRLASRLGAFRFDGAWELRSRTRLSGSYSALLASKDGRLMAFSDAGQLLIFTPPGSGSPRPSMRMLRLSKDPSKRVRDIESATQDAEGTIWLGLEYRNAIARLKRDFTVAAVTQPILMANWGENAGAEAMVRLRDGRFVVLQEAPIEGGAGKHQAVLFAGDATRGAKAAPFTFEGVEGFAPTDMAQLPDGRLLVLMRRLVWPMPQRFVGLLMLGDPADIHANGTWKVREVTRLSSDLPVDNFEGMAISQKTDASGYATVWLISDDNYSHMQRTLLWKLGVRPGDL